MPEEERIRRIGELFAKAAMLYWRGERLAGRAGPRAVDRAVPVRNATELVADETGKKIVQYLSLTGTASPRDISLALDVPRTTLTEKLAQLRSIGLLTVTGKTRAARYELGHGNEVLSCLRLKHTDAEKDLEAAILREMEAFILELGVGFAFLERQKRIPVGGVEHYLDLLFYHRRLRRLIAIDLKLADFAPADQGQMELYLAWLKEHEQAAGEDSPLGLVLCAGKNDKTVRWLGLDQGDIRVSSYLARELPRDELARKLHDAVRLARAGAPAPARGR